MGWGGVEWSGRERNFLQFIWLCTPMIGSSLSPQNSTFSLRALMVDKLNKIMSWKSVSELWWDQYVLASRPQSPISCHTNSPSPALKNYLSKHNPNIFLNDRNIRECGLSQTPSPIMTSLIQALGLILLLLLWEEPFQLALSLCAE
jgi:hypothetical protein